MGVIGAGGIARTHVEHLRAIEGVRVAAVADVVAARAGALAELCDAAEATDHREMLEDVDAVYVCSPPGFHREHVEAAVSAGAHVFCEKPLATTLEDGLAIAEALSSGDVHLMVGFNNRFRRPFRRMRGLLRGGELGDLVSAWITRVAPSRPDPGDNWRTTPGLACGVTIESASHDIDFVRWACGEVESVAAWTASSLPELEGYDDTLNAVLSLHGGRPAALTISWSSALSISSRGILGARGAACLLGPDMWTLSELRWARSGQPETIEQIDEAEGADLGYRAESEHFIECLRTDRTPDVSVRDGLAALEVSIALKDAAAQGRPVKIGDRPPPAG